MMRAAGGGGRVLVDWAEFQIAAPLVAATMRRTASPWVNSKLQAP
jgi:hypothetical protein